MTVEETETIRVDPFTENSLLRYADNQKFRTSNGQLLSRRLFSELATQFNDKSKTYYCLSTLDHPEGYKSLYKLYMDCGDPTEYVFGNKYFEDYSHWEAVSRASWIAPLVKKWRRHLEARLKAQALQSISEIALDSGHKEQFRALTLLLKAGWKDPHSSQRGRPSKDEVQSELDRIATIKSDTQSDYDRIFNKEDSNET